MLNSQRVINQIESIFRQGHLVLGGLLVLTGATLVAQDMGVEFLLCVASLFVIAVGLRFPEIAFLLFINAGIYKAHPTLEALGSTGFLDLTLFFECLCIMGILLGISRKSIRVILPPNKMLIPYAVMAFMCTLSLTYTAAPLYGTQKLLRFLVITTFSLLGPVYVFQDWQCLKRFFTSWIVLSSVAVFDALSGGLEPEEFGFRLAFGSSGYQGLGSISAQAVLMLGFGFLLTTKNILSKLILLGLIGFNTFGVLASGARTSVLVLPIVIAGAFLYAVKRAVRRLLLEFQLKPDDLRTLQTVGLLLVLMTGLGVLGREYFFTFWTRTELLIDNLDELEAERLAFAPAAAQAILTWPLSGLGIGGFSAYFFGFDAERGGFPHNVFLEVGSELGVVGLGAFVLLCYWSMSTAARVLKTLEGAQYFVGVSLGSLFWFALLYFQFHGDINDARSIFLWAGAMFAFERLSMKQ